MNDFVELNEEKKSVIKKTASTAKIYGYILLFSVIVSLFISLVSVINFNAPISGLISTIIGLAVTVVLAIILILFDKHVKVHLNTNDSLSLQKGLCKLKWYFTFQGILYVITIGLILLVFFLFLIFIAAENM